MYCGITHICKKSSKAVNNSHRLTMGGGGQTGHFGPLGHATLKYVPLDPPVVTREGHPRLDMSRPIPSERANCYSACLKLNRFAGCKPLQINQAGSFTKRHGESNDIGFVAHRRVVPCCFSMFFKKLGRFVLVVRNLFAIKEKGYMIVIKLSFKHIVAFPTHQSKKSCINFDQAIVYF